MKHELNFYTGHLQFFICDKASSKETGDHGFWTDEASDAMLAVGEGILGVGIASNGSFKGEFLLLEKKEDDIAYSGYDHIVEAGLDVKSGMLQILDCPGSNIEFELKINPGMYRVRIYSSNLASVEDDSGDDYYRIEIWPEMNMERIVLKQYSYTGTNASDDL